MTALSFPPQPGRAERLRSAMARDGHACVWCGRPCVGLVAPTTDHLVPKVKGGPSWVENEVVACRRCNAARGHTSPVEWFVECERRGWTPNLTTLLGVLRGLEDAIAVRGGQRRARPYLAAQLRRLAALRRRAELPGPARRVEERDSGDHRDGESGCCGPEARRDRLRRAGAPGQGSRR